MPECRPTEELRELLGELVDGQLDGDGARRLDEILWNSPELQAYYNRFITLHGMLHWLASPPLSNVPAPAASAATADRQFGTADYCPAPPLGFLGAAWQGSAGYLASHELLLSYLIAAAVVTAGILIGSATHVSHRHGYQMAGTASAPKTPRSNEDIIYVGRVTGMRDCRWADPQTETYAGAAVPLGRKYALASGLMEITYRSGAKVILEGPCRYEMESSAGGYLALGKLTARIGERGEGRGERAEKWSVVSSQRPGRKKVESGEWRVEKDQRSEVRNRRPDSLATSHSPLATNSSPLSPLPSPLFTVRTPTAVVTDLGTEFGVEVAENGDTTSHVFQGRVVVRAEGSGIRDQGPGARGQGSEKRPATAVAGVGAGNTVQLDAGKSVRVERDAKGVSHIGDVCDVARDPIKFVRQLHLSPAKLHAYAKMVLADRPLFYWTFDESAECAYEQVRRLPRQALQLRGGAGRCSHESIGSGLRLGSAADFSKAAGAFATHKLWHASSMSGAWAIEFWVEAVGGRASRNGQYLFNAGIGANNFYCNRDNPAIIFNWPTDAVENELQLFYGQAGPTHGGPILTLDHWHHLLLVFYGNGDFGVASRVDAVLDGQSRTIDRGAFTSAFNLNGRLCLGAAGEDLSYPFRGRIDELAIYDLNGMTKEQIEIRIGEMARRHFTAATAKQEPEQNNPGSSPKDQREGGAP